MAKDLRTLRNTIAFTFNMINVIYIVFLLQSNKDILHINWLIGFKTNMTFTPQEMEVRHLRWLLTFAKKKNWYEMKIGML